MAKLTKCDYCAGVTEPSECTPIAIRIGHNRGDNYMRELDCCNKCLEAKGIPTKKYYASNDLPTLADQILDGVSEMIADELNDRGV